MTKWWFLASVLFIGALVAPIEPAHAECTWTTQVVLVSGTVQEHAVYQCAGSTDVVGAEIDSASPPETPIADGPPPPRDSGWDAICVRTALATGQQPAAFCDQPLMTNPSAPVPAAAAPVPQVTPGLVLQALRRVGLPGAELEIQPPNGRTLVNLDTNFFTRQGPFARSVTLLGRRVDLRISPESYTWRFGDGVVRSTASPGAAYPHLEVTHRYLRKGRVSPSVDITYGATYRVDGGAWQPVPGAVTVPGAPERLRVVTARPVLVGS